MLLRAKESVSQAAQRAAAAIDKVTASQEQLNAAGKRQTPTLREQITTLDQLVQSHIREKKALEDSSKALRASATARTAEATAARKRLEELRKQAGIERALSNEKEKRDIEEIARIRLEVAEREAADVEKDKDYRAETSRLRKEANLLKALADESSAANKRRAAEVGVQIARTQQQTRETIRSAEGISKAASVEERAHVRVSRSIDVNTKQLDRLREAFNKTEGSTGRVGRALERVGLGGRNAASNLRGLNAEFQGLAIALVVKYAQALITALAGLAAQFVAVAAAAGQAAAGIAAAVGAGAAQAAPVVGVLAASFARLAAVMKVVKLANDQQLRASQDAQTAARAQRTAADQIRSAEERVADAHRNSQQAVNSLSQARSDAAREAIRAQNDVARAQEEGDRNVARAQADVTQARKDAIRTVQDLIAAEEQASLSADQAQAALRRAIQGGDVAGTAQANLDVDTSRRDLTRARQDAAPARTRGVEGVQSVIDAELRLADIRRQSVEQINQAEQQLADTRRSNARQIQGAEQAVADARRQEGRASADLVRTRREARENLEQETSAANKLKDALNQLSPAERTLYRRLVALQEVYRRAARPITDILTRAFTDVVDRTIGLLRDPRILASFRAIAVALSQSIRTVLREATGGQSRGAFQLLSAEAVRNIPIATRIVINLFRASRNVIIAALPAFRLLLRYIEEYSEGLENLSRSTGLSDFFITGIRYARSFFELGLSIVRLFLALAGPGGGAAEGARTVEELTNRIDELTDKVKENADQVREFFAGSREVLDALISVIGNLGRAILQAFDPGSVTALADFLNAVLIPALSNVIQIMGFITQAFHQLFSLPGFAEFAQIAVTFILLAKGMTILRLAVADIMAIIPGFLRAFGLMGVASRGAAAGLAAMSGPVGWIVLGIAALIAAIVLLDRKFHFLGPTFDWIKGVMSDVFDWLKGAAKDVIDWMSDVWTQGLLYWIRWPFVELFKLVPWGVLWDAIITSARAVIAFFSGDLGGPWGTLGRLLSLPFRTFLRVIETIFGIAKTTVTVFLDILAGRFDHAGDVMKDFWGGLVDTFAGAATSLMTILEKVLAAFGKIPGIGGPFKEAAEMIGTARKEIDQWRESLRGNRTTQEKTAEETRKHANRVRTLKERYDDARSAVEKTTPGTDEYRRAVKRAKDAHEDYNHAIRDTIVDIRLARRPTGVLKDNINELGFASTDTADLIKRNLNAVLKEVGADPINVHIVRPRRSGAQRIIGSDNPLLAPPFAGARYMGGVANPYSGSAMDDHMLIDPTGRPVAMMSGTEGVVNAPQMGVINQALGIASSLGALPWGSLNDLWGSGMRHFAGGGMLQLPTNFRSTHETGGLGGYPAIDVFGAPGTRVGSPISGRVVKLSGSAGGPGAGGPFGYSIYISGGGRTYFLTHFGSRAVRLGQRVSRGQVIGTIADYPDRADHIHEGLHGGPMGVTGSGTTAGLGAVIERLRTPRVIGGEGTAVGRGVRAAAGRLTRAANRYIDRQSATTSTTGDPNVTAAPPDANVLAAFRRAIRAANATRVEQLALWEAGIVESGLKNLSYGDADSLGALQERVSIYGRGHALNPYASALRFFREARPFRPWRGSAGMLAAAVQRPAAQFRGRYDAVAGQARRYLQTGGPIKGLPAPRPVRRGLPLAPGLGIAIQPALTAINDAIEEVTASLEQVSRRSLRRSRRIVTRLTRVFDALTGEGGTLDRIRESVSQIATRAATRLQQRQFRIGTAGPQRGVTSDVENAQVALGTLRETRGALNEERDTIQGSIAGAQRAVNDAVRRNNKKAENVARAALANLQGRLEQNTTDMAQNAQDQVEAVESYQQALLDSVTANAERNNSAIDRWARTAAALGVSVDPNVVLGKQIDNMRQQIGGLQGVLAQALRTGNVNLAQQVRSQIDDLNVQIAEAVAQQFQNAVDAVNNEAQRQTTRLDRAARRAQIGGTDFAALGNTLTGRGDVLQTQRAGLQALMNQAAGAGNLDQFNNLADQIDELDTALLENTQAVKDNTDAAFNAATQQVNDRFGFTSGVFGGLQGFLQAFTESTGMDTLAAQVTALQGTSSALTTQQQGLVGQLVKLTGDQGALGLTGRALVDYLVGISSGPVFQSIMAGLDPTQQAAFQDLVTSLISNATATEQNTKALRDISAPSAQSFTSSFWTAFRSAVFTGAGGLLPQYQMTIPGAAVGARVATSGALMVHAGETVRPALVGRDWGGDRGGDTYNLAVSTPTEVLNPTDVGRQLAFYRKTSGR